MTSSLEELPTKAEEAPFPHELREWPRWTATQNFNVSAGLHGKTQNQNESFNSMIWDRIPQMRYVSFTQLEFGMYDAVANFNIGKKASVLIYEKMNLIPGKFTLQGCDKISRKKLFASKYREIDSTQKRRKIRRGKAKQKDDKNKTKEGQTYMAGAF